MKYEIFRGAVAALAAKATDSMDAKLQSDKGEYKGFSPMVELRTATVSSLLYHVELVRAAFSESSAKAYEEAVNALVSIE